MRDSGKKVNTFSDNLFKFLKENPKYAKEMVETLCQSLRIIAITLGVSAVAFGALACYLLITHNLK